VSVRDVGLFAAKALADPAGWDQKAVSLAGVDMTLTQAREVFTRVVGGELPQTWQLFARILLWVIPGVADMFKWFETDGYGADIAALKKIEPTLQDYETWLKETSRWKAKNE
jgi:hypothetical protein